MESEFRHFGWYVILLSTCNYLKQEISSIYAIINKTSPTLNEIDQCERMVSLNFTSLTKLLWILIGNSVDKRLYQNKP